MVPTEIDRRKRPRGTIGRYKSSRTGRRLRQSSRALSIRTTKLGSTKCPGRRPGVPRCRRPVRQVKHFAESGGQPIGSCRSGIAATGNRSQAAHVCDRFEPAARKTQRPSPQFSTGFRRVDQSKSVEPERQALKMCCRRAKIRCTSIDISSVPVAYGASNLSLRNAWALGYFPGFDTPSMSR